MAVGLAGWLVWATAAAATPGWTPLATGVEYRTLVFDPASKGSGLVHVVRIQPDQAVLRLGVSQAHDGGPRTAAAWCDTLGAVAVINAGMFQTDHVRNVGRLVDGALENNTHWNDYRSVLVMGPRRKGIPAAALLDLDAAGARVAAQDYTSHVQNLRLIKAPGTSVWKPNTKAWSEAAVAQDAQGRILFVFTRQGYEMATFNRLLLAAGLDVVAAMHVEGGPEASLSLCRMDPPLHLSGSFETGFNDNNNNAVQWPLPNVIAVLPR